MKKSKPKKKSSPKSKKKIHKAGLRSATASSITVSKLCDVCGTQTNETHCRLACPNCGATRDCSDP